MAFQVSPGVNVSEVDLTTVVPAVSTTTGAIAGHFRWGPADKRVLIDSEDRLVSNFHKPNANTADDFFTAANFLAYGNSLVTVRVVDSSVAKNAVSGTVAAYISNDDYYNETYSHNSSSGDWVARYPGILGNSVKVSVCQSKAAYESASTLHTATYSITQNTKTLTFNQDSITLTTDFTIGDILLLGTNLEQRKITAISGNNITLDSNYTGDTLTRSASAITRRWEFFNSFDHPPTTTVSSNTVNSTGDAIHIAVVDEDGDITGAKGSMIESYSHVSTASDAKTEQGGNNFYKDVINQSSNWIWWGAHNSSLTNAGSEAKKGNDGTAGSGVAFGGATKPVTNSLSLAKDGGVPTTANYTAGYNLFKSSDDVDVSLVMGSSADTTLATHLINNIAEHRKDCVAVISPERTDVVNNDSYDGKQAQDVIAFRDTLPSSSYGVLDSGWKYMYDKYNDVFRYVPLNGDTAGLMVQSDLTRDPWYSPAGYNRGNVKNAVKLAFNPSKADRDELYKKGVNPVVSFPGQGTVLFGDKTMLTQPSAFDRINVRRLFIVLEKAIATAAKFTLFEFNDAFTQSQFKNLVEPFLRDVQGRRGITDFAVVCDGTNNTGEVIDRNEFVGDIYVKPARSINFIQLNFVAVRSGIEFSEIVGKAT
tara:strand:- start:1739 stop:3685 length:1947 start_codon:yes stop_codon:yes gene_type:complete